MAIQNNFPAIKPSLLLDFANTKQLDPRITFTRASTATYYGTQTAKAEENLLLQSQDFTTTWSTASQNSTVTADTTTAPDGTTTADTLTDNATSGVHRVAQTITTSNNNQLVLSCFLKYSTMRWVSLSAATNTGQWAGAKFDVQNGVLGSTSQQGTSWTADSSSITSVGSGWYRCVLVFTPGNSGSLGVYVNGATDGTTFTTSQRGSEVYSGTGSEVFLWGAQLEQRSAVTAYTPTTTAPITNYIPRILTAASGVARFDHNPITFESLGLEIEESRTNLFTYSEQFADAAWTKTRASITANTIVAPSGELTGDALIEDTTATNTHNVGQGISFTSGTTYTVSVFAKATTSPRFLQIIFPSGAFGATRRPVFDLLNGTALPSTDTTASIQNVGNGWYRCVASMQATSTNSASVQLQLADTYTNGSPAYTGNGTSGIYIWGAQLEAGAFATSYIPTVASQVTRAADAASMTGTNFSSWYNAAEGTMYAEANTPSFATTYVFAEINNNSTSNYIRHSTTSAGTTTQFVVVDNTVTQASPGFAVTLGSYRKMAGAYTANSVQQSVNGSLGTEDTSATIPTGLVQINIGSRAAGTSAVNGTIKKIAYYPLRVTNAQLQGLTS